MRRSRTVAALAHHLLAHHLLALAPALVPVLVLVLGLDVFCLVNLVRAKSVRNAPKLAWAIVILAVSAPLGALLYLFFGMERGGRAAASVAPAGPGAAHCAGGPDGAGPRLPPP